MASQTEHEHDAGSMDMREHVRTWNGFVSFMKWQIIGIAIILVLLAIFRTHG